MTDKARIQELAQLLNTFAKNMRRADADPFSMGMRNMTKAAYDIAQAAACLRELEAELRSATARLEASELFHRVAVQQRDRNQRELEAVTAENDRLRALGEDTP